MVGLLTAHIQSLEMLVKMEHLKLRMVGIEENIIITNEGDANLKKIAKICALDLPHSSLAVLVRPKDFDNEILQDKLIILKTRIKNLENKSLIKRDQKMFSKIDRLSITLGHQPIRRSARHLED